MLVHRRMQWFLGIALLAMTASIFVAGHRWSRPLAEIEVPFEYLEAAARLLAAAAGIWHLARRPRTPAAAWLSAALIAQGLSMVLLLAFKATMPGPGVTMSESWWLWQNAAGGARLLLRVAFQWAFWLSIRHWLAGKGVRPVTWMLAGSALTAVLLGLLYIPGLRLGASIAYTQLTMLAAVVFEVLFWLSAARAAYRTLDSRPEALWLAGGSLLLGTACLGGGRTILFAMWGPFLWHTMSAAGVLALVVWLWRGGTPADR